MFSQFMQNSAEKCRSTFSAKLREVSFYGIIRDCTRSFDDLNRNQSGQGQDKSDREIRVFERH
jgi:hypothetical protein